MLLAGLFSGQQEAPMRKVFEIMRDYWYPNLEQVWGTSYIVYWSEKMED